MALAIADLEKHMVVEHITVPGMHGMLTYAHAVRVDRLVFCSGVSAREPDGAVHAPGDPAEQARYCFEKLATILQAAGSSLANVIRVTTYVTSADYRPAIMDVRRQYLTPPLPASTGVVVLALSHPDLVFEIEAVAVVPDGA
jgi:2-iminobutanoate/2-iminopropanoate deaminase